MSRSRGDYRTWGPIPQGLSTPRKASNIRCPVCASIGCGPSTSTSPHSPPETPVKEATGLCVTVSPHPRLGPSRLQARSRRWPAFHAAKAQRALYFYQAIYQAIYKSPRFPLPIEITSSGEDRKTDLEEVEARATPLEPSSKPHASFQLFLPVGAVGTVLTTSCGQCHTLPPHNKTQCPHLG